MDRGQEQKPGRSGGEQEEDADTSGGWYRVGLQLEPVAATESDVIDVPADSSSSTEQVYTSSFTQQGNASSATSTKSCEAKRSAGKLSFRRSYPGGRSVEMGFKIKDRTKPQSVTITLRLDPDTSKSDKDISHYPRHSSLSVQMIDDSDSTTFSGTFPIDPFDDIPASKKNTGLEKRKAAEPVRQTTKMEEGIPEDDEEYQTHSEQLDKQSKDTAATSAEDEKDHHGLLPRLTDLVQSANQMIPLVQPQAVRSKVEQQDKAVSMHGIWPHVSSEVQVGVSLFRMPALTNLKSIIINDAFEGHDILPKDEKVVKTSSLSEPLKTVSRARQESHDRTADIGSFSDASACQQDKNDPHDEVTFVSVTSSAEDAGTLSVSQKCTPTAPPLSHIDLPNNVLQSQERSKLEVPFESASGESLDIQTSRKGTGSEISEDNVSQERSESNKSNPDLPELTPESKKRSASLAQDLLGTQSRESLDIETDPLLIGSVFRELGSNHSIAVHSTRSEDEEVEMDTDDLTSPGIQSTASSAVSSSGTSSNLSNELLPLQKSNSQRESELRNIQPDVSGSVPRSISGEVGAEVDNIHTSLTTLKRSETEVKDQDRSIGSTKAHVVQFLSLNTVLPLSRSFSQKSQAGNKGIYLVPSGTGRTGGLPLTTVFSVPAVLSNARSNTETDDASFIRETSTLKDITGLPSFISAASSGRNLSCQRLNINFDAVPTSPVSVPRSNISGSTQKSNSRRELQAQPEANEVTTVPEVVTVGGPQSDGLEGKTSPAVYQERLNPKKLDIVQDSKVTDFEQISENIFVELTEDTLGLRNVDFEKLSNKVNLLKEESVSDLSGLVVQKESGLIGKSSDTIVSVSSSISIVSSVDGDGFIPASRGEWSDSTEENNVHEDGPTVTHGLSTEQGPESYLDELFDFFVSESGNMIQVKMPPSLSGSEIKKYVSQPQREDTLKVSPILKVQLDETKIMPEFDLKDYRKVAFVPLPFDSEDRKRKLPFIADTMNIKSSPIVVMHTSTGSSQNVFKNISDRGTESASEVVNAPQGSSQAESTLHSQESETVPYSSDEVMPLSSYSNTEIQPPQSESGKIPDEHESITGSSIGSRVSAVIIRGTLQDIYGSRNDSASSTKEMGVEISDQINGPQIVGSAVDTLEQQQVEIENDYSLLEKDRTQLLSQGRDQQESSLEDITHEPVAVGTVMSPTDLRKREDGEVQRLTSPTSVPDRSLLSGELSNIPSLAEQTLENTASGTQTVPIDTGSSLLPRGRAGILQSDNVPQIPGDSLDDISRLDESLLERLSDAVPALSSNPNNSIHSIPESAVQSLNSEVKFGSWFPAPGETLNIDEVDRKEFMKKAPSLHDDESAGNEDGQEPPQLLVSHKEQEEYSALDGVDKNLYTPRSMLMCLPLNNDPGHREKVSDLREHVISASSDEQIFPEDNSTAVQDDIRSKSGKKDRVLSMKQEQTRSAEKLTDIHLPFSAGQPIMPFRIEPLVVSLFHFRRKGNSSEEEALRKRRRPRNVGQDEVEGGHHSSQEAVEEVPVQQAENRVVIRGAEESPVENQQRNVENDEIERYWTSEVPEIPSNEEIAAVAQEIHPRQNSEEFYENVVEKQLAARRGVKEEGEISPTSEESGELVLAQVASTKDGRSSAVGGPTTVEREETEDVGTPVGVKLPRDKRVTGAAGSSSEEEGVVGVASKTKRVGTEISGDNGVDELGMDVVVDDEAASAAGSSTETIVGTDDGVAGGTRRSTKMVATQTIAEISGDFGVIGTEDVVEECGLHVVVLLFDDDEVGSDAGSSTEDAEGITSSKFLVKENGRESDTTFGSMDEGETLKVRLATEAAKGVTSSKVLVKEKGRGSDTKFGSMDEGETLKVRLATEAAEGVTSSKVLVKEKGRGSDTKFGSMDEGETSKVRHSTEDAEGVTSSKVLVKEKGRGSDTKFGSMDEGETSKVRHSTDDAEGVTSSKVLVKEKGRGSDTKFGSMDEGETSKVRHSTEDAEGVTSSKVLVKEKGRGSATKFGSMDEGETSKVRHSTEDAEGVTSSKVLVKEKGRGSDTKFGSMDEGKTLKVRLATEAAEGVTSSKVLVKEKGRGSDTKFGSMDEGETSKVRHSTEDAEGVTSSKVLVKEKGRGSDTKFGSMDEGETPKVRLSTEAEVDEALQGEHGTKDVEDYATVTRGYRVSTAADGQNAVEGSDEGVEGISGEQERPQHRREDDYELRTILIHLGRVFGPTVDEAVLELVAFLKELWNRRPRNTYPEKKM